MNIPPLILYLIVPFGRVADTEPEVDPEPGPPGSGIFVEAAAGSRIRFSCFGGNHSWSRKRFCEKRLTSNVKLKLFHHFCQEKIGSCQFWSEPESGAGAAKALPFGMLYAHHCEDRS